MLREKFEKFIVAERRKEMSRFSVKKPYTVFVAVVICLILGVVSFNRMSTDLLPEFSLPYVVVVTTYPGASETVSTLPETDVRKVSVKRKTKNRSQTCLNISCIVSLTTNL